MDSAVPTMPSPGFRAKAASSGAQPGRGGVTSRGALRTKAIAAIRAQAGPALGIVAQDVRLAVGPRRLRLACRVQGYRPSAQASYTDVGEADGVPEGGEARGG